MDYKLQLPRELVIIQYYFLILLQFDVDAHYHGNKDIIIPNYYHRVDYYHDYDRGGVQLIREDYYD